MPGDETARLLALAEVLEGGLELGDFDHRKGLQKIFLHHILSFFRKVKSTFHSNRVSE